ncbi:MAG: efflux RND transporter periplasmic adaptor subunit [Xanthomonadales bacterium]|nr:efflux RND transporter periplasmic adaptor subunit [Xanthomonadales bacterium]
MNQKSDLISQLRIDHEPEPDQSRQFPWIPLVVALVLLVAAGGWWLSRDDSLPVSIVTAQAATLDESVDLGSSVLDASGYVTARVRATVSSKITAKVTQVLIEEGMTVEQGQVLAYLDDTMTRAQYNLAEAQLERARTALNETQVLLAEARRQLKRTNDLAGKGLASEADQDADASRVEALQARLAIGRDDVRVAENALALQAQSLDDTVIRAPFAGVVVAKAAQPGEMISPISAGGGFTRTGICTIVDMDSLEIEVDVNEAYIDRVQAGQEVTARLDAYPDWQIPSQVIAIIPTADRQKATVRVRIGFLEKDPRILPDMGIKVSFMEVEQLQSVTRTGVTIPATASRQDNGKTLVFVARDGVAQRRSVRASRNGEQLLVLSGIQPGERIIDNPPPGLSDGSAIRIEDESS